MLQRIDLTAGLDDLNSVLPRAATDVAAAAEVVATILADVQARGAEAVMEATERLDGVRPVSLRVPAEVLTAALSGMEPALRAALTESAERARRGHLAQLPQDAETHITPGGTVTQRWIPVRRVGLYVPGGRALYPSTVVMNVVPAQVAGVGQIAITSPAQADNDGWPDPGVLAACALLGVDEVYSAGGAQGIALLGLGSKADPVVEPVDVLTGPGNIYVTAAKRALRDRVAIDSEAGPTEIAVIADETADPVHVALDLISQAEHDPLACSVLITTSAALADAVDAELARRVPATRHAERIAEALSGKQSGTILVASLDDAVAVADGYAAEHLEVQTADAREVAMRITNAGAIFVGPWSPVSLGDYCAGSNHVLPTAGHARFSSGLNTTTFLRSVQVIEYTEAALAVVTPSVLALSAAENLPAHGEAVAARFDLAPVDVS
jgi:histidinol dehydrogenase